MGIEDLNLDLSEHADRVLLIVDDADRLALLKTMLEKRSYKVAPAESIAKAGEMSKKELTDVIVCEMSKTMPHPMTVYELLDKSRMLRTAPLVLITPKPELAEPLKDQQEVAVLLAPCSPVDLIVKLSTMLRVRKLRANESRFQSQIAAQNTQLRDLTNRFKKELQEAQTIQQSLLPEKHPDDPRCQFAAKYIPLEAVGGDLYDIWKVKENLYGMIVADVTGHGLSAAFIGAMTKMALSYAPTETVHKMLEHMNDHISDRLPEGRFVTVEAAFYDAQKRLLSVARGGHPPAYLYRAASKSVEQLDPDGFAFGFVAGMPYGVAERTMEPGDKFLMITDGITETSDMSGGMIGVDGVGDWFAEFAAETDINGCIQKILDRQKVYTGGRILKDDNTLIGFECIGA